MKSALLLIFCFVSCATHVVTQFDGGQTEKVGDVVGEELQGDDRWNRGDERVAGRNRDDVVHAFRGFVVTFGDDPEDAGTTGAAFFHVAERLVLAGDVVGQRDDWRAFLQKCDGPVLQLRRVIALGVDV